MAYLGRGVEVGMWEKQILTPDSTTTTFPLTFAVGSANSLQVVYGGVLQEPGVAYSVSGGGQQIVFSEAPVTGTTLYIIYYGKQLTTPRAAGQETTKQSLTGDGTTTLFTLTDPPVVPAGIMVFVDGILQREGAGNNYVSGGSTINFNGAPDSGAEIDVYTLVKEKVSIDTVADGSITRAKMAATFPYWDAQGNFGIGVATPSTLLHVAKSQNTETGLLVDNQSTGAAGYGVIRLANSVAGGGSGFALFGSGYTTSGIFRSRGGYIYSQSNASGGLTLNTEGAYPLYFATNSTERVRITSGGLVGIGTNSPLATLDVRGNVFLSDTNSNGIISATAGGSSRLYLNSQTTHNLQVAGTDIFTLGLDGTNSYMNFAGSGLANTVQLYAGYSGTSSFLAIGTKNSGTLAEKMRVTSTGQLLIGKTTGNTYLNVQTAFDYQSTTFTSGAGNFGYIALPQTPSTTMMLVDLTNANNGNLNMSFILLVNTRNLAFGGGNGVTVVSSTQGSTGTGGEIGSYAFAITGTTTNLSLRATATLVSGSATIQFSARIIQI